MIKQGAILGVNLNLDSSPAFCKTCVKVKITWLPFPKALECCATVYGEWVHSGVWGPAPVYSLSGSLYYITFTDESTNETCIYFLKKKSDNFATYKHYEAWVGKHHNSNSIKSLHSDQGGLSQWWIHWAPEEQWHSSGIDHVWFTTAEQKSQKAKLNCGWN